MLRRCVLELSRRQFLRRIPNQNPYLLSSRKEFSASSKKNVFQKPPGSVGKPPEPAVTKSHEPEPGSSNLTKLVVGGVLISGVVAAAAYQTVYLNKPKSKDESGEFDFSKNVSKDIGGLGEQGINNQEPNASSNDALHVEEKEKVGSDSPNVVDQNVVEGERQVQSVKPEEDAVTVQQNELPSTSETDVLSDDQNSHSNTLPEDVSDKKEDATSFTDVQSSTEQTDAVNATPTSEKTKATSEETEKKSPSDHNITLQDGIEASPVNGTERPSSLIDIYHLGDNGQRNAASLDRKVDDESIPLSKEGMDSVGTSEDLKDANISKDGNVVLDFLDAIHAAEKRQAELDAQILAEEKRILKETYENKLKNSRARELWLAEEASKLDHELNKERKQAAATVKTLEEKAEERLKMELERKENEAEMQLKKVKELAHAELAAAIASEKASQIEKIAEANLNIDALCMAFYARSEETRQSHSVHKLALGTLALEDALSNGLPIQAEISALHSYLESIDKDKLLSLVLSSLPEETLIHGTETQLQLNQKFDGLKKTLRHYSLIPPGGGGILSHTVAHIASGIKLKESDSSGDGIESIINRVDNLLAQGRLEDAANALEQGVRGSQAEEYIGEWVKKVRERAITEQALTLLQSYAAAISVT